MALTEDFTQYRPYLFSVAYNLLAEVQEAEDVVQDVLVACLEAPEKEIRHPKAYLTRMVANQSIDRLKALQKQRETYPGIWLPEPLVTQDTPDAVAVQGIMSFEVLYALEQLTPTERAVFVLREAFAYPYGELASLLNTTEANCRQLLRRARRKVTIPKSAHVSPSRLQTLMEAFLQACQDQNLDALIQLLHEDAVAYSDGGGKAPAAIRPIVGSTHVGKLFLGLTRKGQAFVPSVVVVNGQPGVLYSTADGTPVSLVLVEIEGDIVNRFFIVRNPDKLKLLKSVTN